MTAVRSRFRLWRIPIMLALVTVAGLLSALVGEGGIWWLASWSALAVPCIASVFYLIRGVC